LIFGLACLASAFSAGLNQLVAWRFITGVGLGAAMPNAVTMMNEYCPEARRATLTNAMFCGFPLGAAFGGFVAAWIIPHFGWRSVLLLGGIAPLFLGVLILFVLFLYCLSLYDIWSPKTILRSASVKRCAVSSQQRQNFPWR
jgi:AAHS family 4-hydroxybenzoate transporter-like MFS transporter